MSSRFSDSHLLHHIPFTHTRGSLTRSFASLLLFLRGSYWTFSCREIVEPDARLPRPCCYGAGPERGRRLALNL